MLYENRSFMRREWGESQAEVEVARWFGCVSFAWARLSVCSVCTSDAKGQDGPEILYSAFSEEHR
jgi:hypothetical protein